MLSDCLEFTGTFVFDFSVVCMPFYWRNVIGFILFSVDPTRPNQLEITPKVKFSKYNNGLFDLAATAGLETQIQYEFLHVVEFIFRNVKSCKHDRHKKYV